HFEKEWHAVAPGENPSPEPGKKMRRRADNDIRTLMGPAHAAGEHRRGERHHIDVTLPTIFPVWGGIEPGKVDTILLVVAGWMPNRDITDQRCHCVMKGCSENGRLPSMSSQEPAEFDMTCDTGHIRRDRILIDHPHYTALHAWLF